jgi:phenylalanine-4-hydroxylase
VQPGHTVQLRPIGKELQLTTDIGTTTVGGLVARHVFVSMV